VLGKLEFFRDDWHKIGLWNLVFLAGVLIGGFLASPFAAPQSVNISFNTVSPLRGLGIHEFTGVAPCELFTWHALLTLRGIISVVVG
jgi:hypothetical protein